jgi:DNA modification methylase
LWQHEPCLYGWIKGNKAPVVEGMLGQNRTIWDAENPQGSVDNLHPTSKPTILFEIPMQTHTKSGEICYEPFSGSGSQLVAGEKLGRLVYGIEISPYFVAGILERISGMGCEVRQI